MIEDAESGGEIAHYPDQTPAHGGKPVVNRALCSRPSSHATHYMGPPPGLTGSRAPAWIECLCVTRPAVGLPWGRHRVLGRSAQQPAQRRGRAEAPRAEVRVVAVARQHEDVHALGGSHNLALWASAAGFAPHRAPE